MTQLTKRTLTITPALAALALAAPSNAAPYYQGKTVTLIVGLGGGGGPDIMARLLARHLPKHLEGSPKVIVKNMPGARFMKAHNFIFEKAKLDGLNFYYGPWFWGGDVIKTPGHRFKYKDFTMVGALRTSGRLQWMRTDVVPGGAKNWRDIFKVKNLRFASTGSTTGFAMQGLLGMDLLGLKYKFISGYRGSSKVRIAMRNNEANSMVDSTHSYRFNTVRSMIKPGKGIPLWYFPYVDDKGNVLKSKTLPEFISLPDAYKEIHGKEISGPKWDLLKLGMRLARLSHLVLGPPNMNKAATAAMSKGVWAALNSKPYQNEAKKSVTFYPTPVRIKTARTTVASLANISPTLLESLKAFDAQANHIKVRSKSGKKRGGKKK